MQEAISQVVLPSVLAFIMLSMGLSLKLSDFKRIVEEPKSILLGLLLQLTVLPLLAVMIAALFSLPASASVGLFLLALCPGGATSNLMSYLAKGNVALSVSLTAITSFIVPVSLPLLLVLYMNYMGDSVTGFTMPLGVMIKKLVIITILPVISGMTIRHFYSAFAQDVEKRLKVIASLSLIVIVFTLIFTNISMMLDMLSTQGIAVVSLCFVALFVSYQVSRAVLISKQNIKTITLEVGVQNAGTAMMVAITILQQPQLAFIPLMYGILMNVPAFLFVWWAQKH